VEKVFIYGDSILRGVVWSEESGRYVVSGGALGMEDIGAAYDLSIVNHSRFGCTAPRGAASVYRQLEAGQEGDLVVLEWGGNDSDFDWARVAETPEAEHNSFTPLHTFADTLRRAITFLRNKGMTVVLGNLPPVCSGRYLNWITRGGLSRDSILRFLGDENAIYRYQEQYSRQIDCIAAETACPLVDIRGAFLAQRKVESHYCIDGIHPNQAGQSLIKQAFLQALDRSPRFGGRKKLTV